MITLTAPQLGLCKPPRQRYDPTNKTLTCPCRRRYKVHEYEPCRRLMCLECERVLTIPATHEPGDLVSHPIPVSTPPVDDLLIIDLEECETTPDASCGEEPELQQHSFRDIRRTFQDFHRSQKIMARQAIQNNSRPRSPWLPSPVSVGLTICIGLVTLVFVVGHSSHARVTTERYLAARERARKTTIEARRHAAAKQDTPDGLRPGQQVELAGVVPLGSVNPAPKNRFLMITHQGRRVWIRGSADGHRAVSEIIRGHHKGQQICLQLTGVVRPSASVKAETNLDAITVEADAISRLDPIEFSRLSASGERR